MDRYMDRYILDENGEPVQEDDLDKWALMFKSDKRKVALDTFGDVRVSTVFLGLDHQHGLDGPPLLWETMVFGGKFDQDQMRCPGSRADALAMHQRMVDKVKGAQ